jgi:OOP family OmpA-OmpF porin
VVVCEGHTDSRGTEAYNDALSMRRARSVRDYLIKGGIPSKDIKVEGFGETKPVASNDTDEGRQQNRRVELRLMGN